MGGPPGTLSGCEGGREGEGGAPGGGRKGGGGGGGGDPGGAPGGHEGLGGGDGGEGSWGGRGGAGGSAGGDGGGCVSDHELALRVSAWLACKPRPPSFDSDAPGLMVRGEQPPTQSQPVGYLWAQTLEEVALSVLVPRGTRARSVDVTFRRSHLRLALTAPPRLLLDVALLCPVVPDGCSWTLEQGPSQGGTGEGEGQGGGDSTHSTHSTRSTLMVVLEKAERGGFWRCVADGHDSVTIPQAWPIVGI